MITQAKKMSKHTIFSTIQDAQKECLLVAVATIQEAKRALSISQAFKYYNIPKMTLFDQFLGSCDQVLFKHSKQKLTMEEEASLKSWILQLQTWGWPLKILLLCDIANILL